MSDVHSYALVDSRGVTHGSNLFHNYREAAHGLGLSDYLVSLGWAVIQTDGDVPTSSLT